MEIITNGLIHQPHIALVAVSAPVVLRSFAPPVKNRFILTLIRTVSPSLNDLSPAVAVDGLSTIGGRVILGDRGEIFPLASREWKSGTACPPRSPPRPREPGGWHLILGEEFAAARTTVTMDSLSSPFPETFPRAVGRQGAPTPGLSLALGVFLFLAGGLSTSAQAGRTVEAGFTLAFGGLFLLALAYGLTLLYRIERHLHARSD
jgi:hypothetical protein